MIDLRRLGAALAVLVATMSAALAAGPGTAVEPIMIAGIPVDFILFALTLLGVALFHHHTFYVSMTGLAAITLYKLLFTGFKFGTGLAGLAAHMGHEWVILANLFLLLMGFALLANHFEKSGISDVMPALLPDDWKGAFCLLAIVWFISSFLDNIAAALIGGTMAMKLFKSKLHIGYIAGIVAASNAGGAFSVVGDTTTTMMWIDGVNPLSVFDCIVASVIALFISGIIAAKQQHAYQPIAKDADPNARIDWGRVSVVAAILLAAIGANVWANKWARIPAACPIFARDWHWRGIRDFAAGALSQARMEIAGREFQGYTVSAGARHLRLDDAGRKTTAGLLADGLLPRLCVGGIRQHPAHRPCPEARRL